MVLKEETPALNPLFSPSAESPTPRGSLGPLRSSGSCQLCEHSDDEATVSPCVVLLMAGNAQFSLASCTKVQLYELLPQQVLPPLDLWMEES